MIEQRYQEQIKNKYNFGYQEAQEYYITLKNKMLKQMDYNLKQKFSKAEKQAKDLVIENIFDELMKTTIEESKIQKEEAEKILTTVDNIVDSVITGQDINTYPDLKFITETTQSLQKYKEQHPDSYKMGLMRPFTNSFKQFLEENKNSVVHQILGNSNFLNLQGRQKEDKIRTALESYAIRTFSKKITTGTATEEFFKRMRTTSYVNLLKGLIREAVVADAFNKLYRKIIKSPHTSKTKIVIPWGSETTSQKGKESAIDLLINTCFNEKETKKLFNQVYNGTVELDIEAEIEKVLDVKNETKVFGAQVKSFDVKKGNFIGGLGTNTNLKNELYSSIQYGQGYSLIGTIAFMGQRNNIIKALGPHNVIYADGKNQYWMDNFIEVFRGRDMYLILNDKKEENSSNRRRASAEIALYNYMSSKSHRW